MKSFSVMIFSGVMILFPFFQANAQFKNIKINKSDNFPEEVSITANPANPLNIAAGSNHDNYYYSFDGGNSWSEGQLTSTFGVGGDPSLTFDADGNLYYAHLADPPQNTVGEYWLDRIVVQKSTDGGKTWDQGTGTGYFPPRKNQDKEWITSDKTNSKFKNNLYMSWTQFDKYASKLPTDSSRILFSRSTDGGASWSTAFVISDSSGNCRDGDSTVEGAVPAIGPNGEIYVSWAGPSGIKFDKSLDGGLTFGKDVYVTSQPGGWDFGIDGVDRCNGMPVTLCDNSNSLYRGNIYINWSDQRNELGNTDVFITKSTDGGTTWSEAKKVNETNDSHRDRFFTWATIDPSNGHLWVLYYDRSQTSGTATDVFLSRSTDGGETFTSFKISDSSFAATTMQFLGDYTNIAALNGKVYPIWTRMDKGNLSIWTALVDESLLGVKSEGSLMPEKFFLYQNYPNPFNPSTTIDYYLPRPEHVRLAVYNSLGRMVSEIENDFQEKGKHSLRFDAGGLPSGLYSYRLFTDGYSISKKMLLIK